jgi:hypothetical protein
LLSSLPLCSSSSLSLLRRKPRHRFMTHRNPRHLQPFALL